ncbi:MAG: biliverdin-producing heme oxygenase [Paracoccaceae bacterium]
MGLSAGKACSSSQSRAIRSQSLALDLRTRTAALHDRAETLLGLPDSITSRAEYADWLAHFLAFYAPLERAFDTFVGWDLLEPFSGSSLHSRRLSRDLLELGIPDQERTGTPTLRWPALQTFAQALGARYVLEGSALGGKVILKDLQARIGPEIAGATAFFEGSERSASSRWGVFKMAVDRYGEQHPECGEDVLTGAELTFKSLLDWFEPFVAQKKAHARPSFRNSAQSKGAEAMHPDPAGNPA